MEKTPRRNDKCLERHPLDPTPEEIRAMCAEIRKSWSPATRKSRRVINNQVPQVFEVNDSWVIHELPYQQEMPLNSWV